MKTPFLVTVLALSAALGSTIGSAAPIVSIGSEMVAPGGTTTVNLNVSGLGSGTALGAFDVNVAFNPAVVSFSSVTYGDSQLGDQLNLEGFGTFSNTTPGSGQVELAELSFDSTSALQTSQASNFSLATLTFNALSQGVSSLTLSLNAVADAFGNSLTPALQNGSITVSGGQTFNAPEIDPASAVSALTLLLGGLAVLSGRRAH